MSVGACSERLAGTVVLLLTALTGSRRTRTALPHHLGEGQDIASSYSDFFAYLRTLQQRFHHLLDLKPVP